MRSSQVGRHDYLPPFKGKIINNELIVLLEDQGDTQDRRGTARVQKFDLTSNKLIFEHLFEFRFSIQLTGYIDKNGDLFFTLMHSNLTKIMQRPMPI